MQKVIGIFIFALIFANTTFADFKELANTAEFEALVAESQVPVVVKFSAYW